MEKFIPYEKLSKKEQKKRNAERRGTWGPMSPVTRKPPNSRAYKRQRPQDLDRSCGLFLSEAV